MTDTPSLDLAATKTAIRLVENAYVVPPEPTATLRRASNSGVLDADGAMVEQSISWTTSAERVNQAPQKPTEAKHLPGTYIFGGVLYGHFGHFIVESLARLWAQDAEGVEAQGMIFTPKIATLTDKVISQLERNAQFLGLRIPLIVAREPLFVNRLYVPAQGFGMNDLIEGSAAFRTFINTHAGKSVAPVGPERMYISRSTLPRDRGSVLGEYKLEQYLQEEGYDIFHPQKFKMDEQIARYKAARYIVGVDCSPFHLVGYVGNADQNVSIILRRHMPVAKSLAVQLTVFKGMKVKEVDCLVDDWMPMPGHRPSRSSWGELDFPMLHASLLASGHIKNSTPWPKLTEDERAAELARIEALHGTTFRSYNEFLASRKAKIRPSSVPNNN